MLARSPSSAASARSTSPRVLTLGTTTESTTTASGVWTGASLTTFGARAALATVRAGTPPLPQQTRR